MMQKLKILSALLLLGIRSFALPADSIRQFAETVNRFNHVFPQEKVYLHLDNTGYFMDETIWFKAYMFRSDNDSVGSLSKVLYVELVSQGGDVISTQKVKIENGTGHGEIDLHDLLVSGYYEVRAYTRYMLNWGQDAIFSRVIPIFEKPEKDGDYSRPTINESYSQRMLPDHREETEGRLRQLNIKFYPEGGKSIKGLRNRMAFTLTDKNGGSVDAEYWLDDQEDGVHGRIVREGMGVIETEAGSTARFLHVISGSGKKETFQLPEAEHSGCALQVDAVHGDSVSLELTSTADLYGQEVGVTWMHNGKMYDCQVFTLGREALKTSKARDSIADGVNQITVINQRGEILAYRTVFCYPKRETVPIKVSPYNLTTLVGGKMIMEVNTLPNTTLSMAITDATAQTGGWNHNAATWLLLTSDLRGYISDPEYYLESDDEEHRRAADLLMMVQGWRRYDFQTMEGKKTFEIKYGLEDKLYIDGKLHKYNRKKTVDNVLLSVMLTNNLGDRLLGQTITDKRGNYAFALPDCYRDWDMIISTVKDQKFVRYYVGVNRHFSPTPRHIYYGERQPISIKEPTLKFTAFNDSDPAEWKSDDTQVLEEVVVHGKMWRNPRDFWQRESEGARHAAISYDCSKEADNLLDQGIAPPSLIEFLRRNNEMIEGNDNISGSPRYANMSYNFYTDGPSYDRKPIMWVVNNVFHSCTSAPPRLSATPTEDEHPTEMAGNDFPTSLDEVKRVYISLDKTDSRKFRRVFGNIDLMGTNFVTIYVYTFPSAGVKPMKGIRMTHFEGFNVPKEYEVEEVTGLRPEKDFRRTLYWNPDLRTNEEGRAVIECLMGPKSKMVMISAEGFTKDGTPMVY